MKKKKTIIAMICILVLWIAIGVVDYRRVHSFEKPVFCVDTEPADDGGSGKYIGLGYSFDITAISIYRERKISVGRRV